jgi:hypothetical protein
MAKIKQSSKYMQFAQAAIGSRNRIWFSAEEDDLFRLLQLKAEKWSVKTPEWNIVSLTGAEKGDGDFEVIALGSNGELLTGIPGGFSESHLDGKDQSPAKLGILRSIKMIDDVVAAVGMGRQVYTRRKGKWSNVSIKTDPAAEGVVIGLNAIDGPTADQLFAAGYNGEVWMYQAKKWQPVETKTTATLNDLLCTPAGEVYVCGMSGIILKGNEKGFTPVENEITKDNLYSITVFKGKLYVSSLTSVYVINNNKLEAVKGTAGFSTGHLAANDDIMISTGAKHILLTEDGVKWEQVFCTV